MLDQLIMKFPPWFVAVVVLAVFVVGLYVFNPPTTVCDVQMDVFKRAQRSFLATTGRGSVQLRSEIDRSIRQCLEGNSPGACLDLFRGMGRLATDLEAVQSQCVAAVGEVPGVRAAVLRSAEVMVQVAWGDAGPMSQAGRASWLDTADVAVFCRLRRAATAIVGREAFEAWQQSVLGKLPGFSKLQREDALSKTLFAVNCESFR